MLLDIPKEKEEEEEERERPEKKEEGGGICGTELIAIGREKEGKSGQEKIGNRMKRFVGRSRVL